jgi:hypothetical protein
MADSIEVSKEDARFVAEVNAVIKQAIPNVVKVERYLSVPVLAFSLLASVGILGLAGWGAKIVWEKHLKGVVKSVVDELDNDLKRPTSVAIQDLASMSKTFDSTFETHVDSAVYKVLRFGCNRELKLTNDFPACNAISRRDVLFQAREDLSIPFVANLKQQKVQLELSVYPVDPADSLAQVQLELYLDPAFVRTQQKPGRVRIELRPDEVKSEGNFVQDGKLDVNNGAQLLAASVDLSKVLERTKLGASGHAHTLRFQASSEDPAFDGAPRFYVRTIVFAHHRFVRQAASQEKK